MEDDFKFLLNDIANSIKEINERLRIIELDLQKSKIYNSFLECNYNAFVELIENFKNNKQTKKEILNNTLKNVFWGAISFAAGVFFLGLTFFLTKIIK